MKKDIDVLRGDEEMSGIQIYAIVVSLISILLMVFVKVLIMRFQND